MRFPTLGSHGGNFTIDGPDFDKLRAVLGSNFRFLLRRFGCPNQPGPQLILLVDDAFTFADRG